MAPLPRKSTRRHRSQRVSQTDVARAAHVSTMTVSRVVNGKTSVGEATRQRVQAAMRELGYCLHPSARSLALAHLERIALLHDNSRATSQSGLLIGALEESYRKSVQILVRRVELANQSMDDLIRKLVADGVAGVILPPPLGDAAGLLEALAIARMPVVAICAGATRAEMHIGIDERGAAYELTRHLLALGHRRIGFIKGPSRWSASAERWAGFAAAMQDGGLDVGSSPVAQGQCTYRSGIEAARILLDARPMPTAIFASCDQMAAASIAVAQHRGLPVPDAITVVGCDESPAACAIWPELTTVRCPISAMAAEAVGMLTEAIRTLRAGGRPQYRRAIIPHHLMLRASTSSPRPAA
jgi:LacI family transcriptional regulator